LADPDFIVGKRGVSMRYYYIL